MSERRAYRERGQLQSTQRYKLVVATCEQELTAAIAELPGGLACVRSQRPKHLSLLVRVI